MIRERLLQRALERGKPWDMIVIGGGATGAGIAVDAASRHYDVLLLERHDFGSGTSSRSTKLIHGGVRYLKQGHLPLVVEALQERRRLLRNAPHLVHDLPFIIPSYRWWETPYYGVGLGAYDLLAIGNDHGSRMLSRRETAHRMPTLRANGLKGGVLYHDGQFDDTRLLISLIKTGVFHGAIALNHMPVVGLARTSSGQIAGVAFRDEETNRTYEAAARIVINATGVFCDGVRRLANPSAPPLVAPSQGTHLVFDRRFLPCDAALMVPQTADGRVLFAIPWHGHTLVGTTDVAVPQAAAEPRATAPEIDFILATAGQYLTPAPTKADVLSVFTGIRPLVQAQPGMSTAQLSREHVIHDDAGMLTVTGGKWTTYRRMAEQAIDRAASRAGLPERKCLTRNLPIIDQMPIPAAPRLHPTLPYTTSHVVIAARDEMACTVEDVLARRTRALFLNARVAAELAPQVAEIIAKEQNRDAAWQRAQVKAFTELARGYQLGE